MKNTIFSILMLFGTILFAQNNYEDVVYLKNGSIVHGIIIEQIPNDYIKIQDNGRSVWVFKVAEIQKMTREAISENNNQNNVVLNNANYPDETAVREMLGKHITAVSYGRIKLNSFQKTNGIQNGIDKNLYVVEYIAYIELINEVRKIDWITTRFGITKPGSKEDQDGIYGSGSIIPAGKKYKIIGKLDLENTYNGWRIRMVDMFKSIKEIDGSVATIVDNSNTTNSPNSGQQQMASFSNPYKKDFYFKVPNSPFGKTEIFKLSAPVNNCNSCDNIDYELFITEAYSKITTSNRFASATKEEYENQPDSIKGNAVITFNNLKWQTYKLSTGQTNNIVTMYFHYDMYIGDKKYTSEDLKMNGDGLMYTNNKEGALIELSKNLSTWAGVWVSYFFSIQGDLVSIDDQNNKKITSIIIRDNGYSDRKCTTGYILIKKGDIYDKGGGAMGIRTSTAKAISKEFLENGLVRCKVIDGGQELKELIDKGIKFEFVSTSKNRIEKYELKQQ